MRGLRARPTTSRAAQTRSSPPASIWPPVALGAGDEFKTVTEKIDIIMPTDSRQRSQKGAIPRCSARSNWRR